MQDRAKKSGITVNIIKYYCGLIMDKLEPTPTEVESHTSAKTKTKTKPIIIFIACIVSALVILIAWQLFNTKQEIEQPENASKITQQQSAKPVYKEPTEEFEQSEAIVLEPEVPASKNINQAKVVETKSKSSQITLPTLDESDAWLQQKIPEITWREELVSLIITEDMIRRFVVFTDNFSQGLIAYDHSPFVKPDKRLVIDESKPITGKKAVWAWDQQTSKRFDVYVDLLRSLNSSILVDSYFEFKPLIDEAYTELGYDNDFTEVLQEAINRVLDLQLPTLPMNLTRTSVMYKFDNPELEALDDSDKFLLRIGKENLLIIKSMLLEVNEKLAVSDNP